MGDCPDGMSIDRKDNNKGYFKNNCRWADKKTQSRNLRKNKFITYNGKTMIVPDWAEELGMNRTTIYGRLRRNLPLDEVFEKGYRRKQKEGGGENVGE